MENVTITYNDRKLIIQGFSVDADPSVGIMGETFMAEEIKCNDIHVLDDYDCDELDEIEDLCFKELKEIHQSNLEDLIN